MGWDDQGRLHRGGVSCNCALKDVYLQIEEKKEGEHSGQEEQRKGPEVVKHWGSLKQTMSMDRWTDKEDVVYTYNGIPLSHKRMK